jgi:NAD(P)-dependent dehydrogenase (short-subunit alcohol dehydrogenase family)
MNLHLNNKTAIVTGSSKGIGKGIVQVLVREGCNVVICARHEDELNQTARILGSSDGDVLAVPADLTNGADIKRIVQRTAEKFDGIDILINNVGMAGENGAFEETPIEEWKSLFELNLFAAVELTRKVIPFMKEQHWGRIINISSENGEQPYPDMIHYNASKAALSNFSKALSKQYASDGILVNTVSPAFIQTPLVDKMMEKAAGEQGIAKEEMINQFLEEQRPHIELKRPGKI